MRIDLLQQLAKLGNTFTVNEVKKELKIPQEVLWVLLSRLEQQGRIERIEKGKYMVIPLGSKKGRYTLNEFTLGNLVIDPCIIAYWSALHHHGLTEQIPLTVFIQTTSRKKKRDLKIFGIPYKIIRVKPEKIFGTEKLWLDETEVLITNKEKTIVDCLDKPKYAGGIIEVTKALKEKSIDLEKIKDYAIKLNNSAVTRRLGYLCDTLEIPIKLDYDKIKKYLKKVRNYIPLDPTMPHEGPKNTKWQVIVNWDEYD